MSGRRALYVGRVLLAAIVPSSSPLQLAGAAEQRPLAVSLGVTNLLEDPPCTVGYQRFGEEPRVLGWRWTGFDPASGVYFVPETNDEGRHQLFMHCPWQAGPGVAFAEFRLRLPQTSRVCLELATALRATAPNSDGVTYRVNVDGKTLWESHCVWKTWRDFQVDVSALAGRTVSLRLEVDPGPKRNTTDDWSLWGKARIIAGTDAEVKEATARREKERTEQRRREFLAAARLAEADLTPFARGDVTTSRPSTAAPVQNSLSRRGDAFVLMCRARDETVEFRFDPRRGLLEGLEVSVSGKLLDPSPFVGGPQVLLDGREFGSGSEGLTCKLVSCAVVDKALVCRYEYRAPEAAAPASLTARLRTEGKSLALSLEGEANRFSGFALSAHGLKEVPTTFAVGCVPRAHPQGVYVSAFTDLWQTDASGLGAGGKQDRTYYSPLTDGTRRALHDTFYLTVSSRYEETLANLPHRPSPFLEELSHRVVLDAWGGSFSENAQWLRDMARYGINHFLIIKHVWQRDGYDHTYPNVMPANAEMGGDEGLRRLSLTAQELGHRFCVHENFYDYYPNAEAFRQEDYALTSAGKTIAGWDNGTVRAVILKPSKLLDYARQFTPEVFRRYSCNGAYHDIMPTWHVDYDARVRGSGLIRQTHEYTRQLCDFDRKLFGGPVVFEGADPMLAGIYDGGCNHGVDTYRTPLAVAYELLKVHPKMSNHGFGYYERWLPWGYTQPNWGTYVMTDRELDKYRATQIAFGRTGFIGQQLMKHRHGVVREYHLMQAFGRAYTGKELRRLAYFVGGIGWIDPATAACHEEWSHLRGTYEGGQQVFVNLSQTPWTIASHTLPPYGTLTIGPRATACTALFDGQIADYAAYDDLSYADARSHQWLPPEPLPPITPTLGEWKDNGDGTFDLTINWNVGRLLERDLTVFWHFKEGDRILFQYDHVPPTPTTQWHVGENVKDGPHHIRVRADDQQTQYEVVVGLYDKTGRAPLVRGASQMRIGTLHVVREGGQVTKIELSPAAANLEPGAAREPYLVDANREKVMVDFGDVATNGAVVVRRIGEGREVIPVPIGEPLRVGLFGMVRRVTPVDARGKLLPNLTTQTAKGKTWFGVPPEAVRVVVGK